MTASHMDAIENGDARNAEAGAPSVGPDFDFRRLIRNPWLPALLGILCFFTSLFGGFVRDDVLMIERNPRIQHPADFRAIWMTDWWQTLSDAGHATPSADRDRLYRPLSLYTFAVQYAVHGMNPFLFRLANVILHGLACALVWKFVLRLFDSHASAALAACLFAVHPIHAEAVAEMVGRAEILATIFMLLGLLLLLPPGRLPGVGRVLAAAVCFFLALLAKETAICYPAVAAIAAWHCYRVHAVDQALGWRRLTLLLVLLAVPLAPYFAMRNVALEGVLIRPKLISILGNPLRDADLAGRIHGPLTILGHYTRLMLFPAKLSNNYGLAIIDPKAGPNQSTLVGAVVALGMVVLAARWAFAAVRSRQPGRQPSWFVYYGPLAAMLLCSYLLISNTFLLIGVTLAERLMYWPSVLVLAAAATFFVRLIEDSRATSGSPAMRARIAAGVLGVAMLAFAGRSALRGMDWQSDLTLFASDYAAYPQSVISATSYGRQLVWTSRNAVGRQRADYLDRAVQVLNDAIKLHPNYPQALQQLGVAHELKGDRQRAAQYFSAALQFDPTDALSRDSLGRVRGVSAAAQQRVRELEQRIAENPADPGLRVTLSTQLFALGQAAAAIEHLEAAIAAAPNHPGAHSAYAQALLLVGRQADARPVLEKAIELNPRDWRSHTNLAGILVERDLSAALSHAQAAVDIEPNDVTARLNLAEMLATAHRAAEAIPHFKAAMEAMSADDPNRRLIESRLKAIESQKK
ncbi:MAG: tetratricopeptide repeat protein [Planctomycetes bacterium]|nr:tetratricopeptide repeat protein [Planctomycetota bacterium]